MYWALQRQLLFAAGALALFLIIIAGLYVLYAYEPPTCTDSIQNQNEEGVDCGGVCARLCESPNVSVVWARSVRAASGVYHAVASVRNPDTNASGSVAYEVSLFDEDNILIARRSGEMTIAPGEIAPLFEPNIVVGERPPARTFVMLEPGVFEKETRDISPVRVVNWDFDEVNLLLTATIQNQRATRVENVEVTTLLFNATDTLVSASQTRSGSIDPQGRVTVTFTWQEPFVEAITRVDIVPRVVGE